MNYREIKMDLFEMPQGYYLAHCTSEDFYFGYGIAKQFDEEFNMKKKLDFFYGSGDFLGKALIIDNVFNLIAKRNHRDRFEDANVLAALEDMKNKCRCMLITKVAMPKIACGNNKQNWANVRDMIKSVFEDTDIDIVVCVQDDSDEYDSEEIKKEDDGYLDLYTGEYLRSRGLTPDARRKAQSESKESDRDRTYGKHGRMPRVSCTYYNKENGEEVDLSDLFNILMGTID